MKRKAVDIASFFRKSSKQQPNDSETQQNNRQEEREIICLNTRSDIEIIIYCLKIPKAFEI